MISQWFLFPRDSVSLMNGAASSFRAFCPSREYDFVEVRADHLGSIRNMESIFNVLCVSFNFGVSTKQLHEEHYCY